MLAVFEVPDVGTVAVNLGGTESLVDDPATMSASYLTGVEREVAGISGSLVRISFDVEYAEDPIAALDRTLAKV